MLNKSGEQTGVELELTGGTPVFDANGEKLGEIATPTIQGDYFVVEKGLIFTHQFLVPLKAIHACDANGLYLNLSKDDLQRSQGDMPPPGDSAAETASPLTPPIRADSGLNAPIEPGILGSPPPEAEPPLGQR
jgi:hypothetical protein